MKITGNDNSFHAGPILQSITNFWKMILETDFQTGIILARQKLLKPQKFGRKFWRCGLHVMILNRAVSLRTPQPATEAPRKTPKRLHPGQKFWTPRTYPQNTRKIPEQDTEMKKSVRFFGYLGGLSSGLQTFNQGVFFVFLKKFRVWPSQGSVAG